MNYENKLKLFKALANKTRLKILECLVERKKNVKEIVKYTKRPQPTVSLQLKKLEYLNIVNSRRNGRKIYYKIINKHVKKMLKILK